MTGALLRSGTLRDYGPLGAVGSPVYTSASQLRAAIRRQRELGSGIADMFAIPKENDRGDVIDWYAPAEGDVVPWSAAAPEERVAAKAALLSARRRLAAKAAELQQAEETERQVFGRLLAQAMQIPGDEHVYLVGGRPVMTFWGFRALNARDSGDVIGSLSTGGAEPSQAQPAEAETPIPASAVPAPEPARRWWRRWWWLIPLFLLLLLLLAIGLKSCGVDVPLGDRLPVIPGLSEQPRETKPAGTSDVQGGVTVPSVEIDHQVTSVVGGTATTATAVPGSAAEGTEATGPTAQGTGPTGVHPVPDLAHQGGAPAGADEAGKQPDTGAAKGTPPAPGAGEGAKTEPPPTPQQLGSEAKQGQPPAQPAEASQRAEDQGKKAGEQPLVIPQSAANNGSTAFLDGDWRSMTGLRDRSGNPVVLNYTFKNGEGRVNLNRNVGGTTQKCEGQARASMSGGQLQIDQKDVRCADGTTFTDSRVRCKMGADGEAECRGLNADGSDYDVRIVK
jgi:hypothetical protein